MTEHGYPQAMVDLAHTSVRCFYENNFLDGFLDRLNGQSSEMDTARTELKSWLAMWVEYGALMRVGGLSDVFSARPFKPDPAPKDLKEFIRRAQESNSALLQLLAAGVDQSKDGENVLLKFIRRLGSLKQSLSNLSDYLERNPSDF